MFWGFVLSRLTFSFSVVGRSRFCLFLVPTDITLLNPWVPRFFSISHSRVLSLYLSVSEERILFVWSLGPFYAVDWMIPCSQGDTDIFRLCLHLGKTGFIGERVSMRLFSPFLPDFSETSP